MYAILRSRKRFETLREFTLESAQDEIDRLNQQRKEANAASATRSRARSSSLDSLRSPTSAARESQSLGEIPEEHDAAFAIGDDDESDDNDETAALRSPQQRNRGSRRTSNESSRAASISSATEDVPIQLRGLSEKARGKMPVGAPSFSRQNSMSSLHSLNSPVIGYSGGGFIPSAEWVRNHIVPISYVTY